MSQQHHFDPMAGTTNSNGVQYLFGKKVERKRATMLKGPGHSLPVRPATDADFITPPTTLNVVRPQYSRRVVKPVVSSQNGEGASAGLRDTAVNRDAVKRALDLQPAQVEQCTERIAPVYSSFGTCKAVGWGRPRKSAFKPFVGDSLVKNKEVTEFNTEVRSSIKGVTTPGRPTASMVRQSVSRERSVSQSVNRNSERLKWLSRAEDTPGPGQYFVP